MTKPSCNVRMSREDHLRFRLFALREGKSKGEALRMLLDWWEVTSSVRRIFIEAAGECERWFLRGESNGQGKPIGVLAAGDVRESAP